MLRERVAFFWALLANWAIVIGIKLERVTIPTFSVVDASILLSCDFDIQDDQLLSLKWYKDNHEFFRYFMHGSFRIQTFPVDGVHVDTVQSSMNSVVLKNVTLKTSGTYKCEVSADRPSFRTLSKQGDIIVIAPPKKTPEISGVHPVVSVGDTITANCTSYRSKPVASLTWYLNDVSFQPDNGDLIEYLPISEHDGLETSVLGLRFQVEPKHFRSGILEIKCTATIGNGYWVTEKRVSQASINAQPSSPLGHNRLLAGASHMGGESKRWFVAVALVLSANLMLGVTI